MTPAEVITFLRAFNEWRRGGDIDQPGPLAVGEAIDAAVEMIERLEAAESDALEQSRLNGMGSEREAALMAKLEAAEKTNSDWLRANAPGGWIDDLRVERDALRGKIVEMERQEPYCWTTSPPSGHYSRFNPEVDRWIENGWTVVQLYLAPGAQAQPVPSVPDISDDMIEAIESRAEQSYRRRHSGVRGQQITPADALSWHIIHATRSVLVEAMEASRAT